MSARHGCSRASGGVWTQRGLELAKLVRNASAGLHLSEHLHGDGTEIFEHACKLGCEGIVSKRIGSRYVSGRTDNWIKVKNPAAPAITLAEPICRASHRVDPS